MTDLTNAWNSMGYFEGFLFTIWIIGLYYIKLRMDKWYHITVEKKTVHRVRVESDSHLDVENHNHPW